MEHNHVHGEDAEEFASGKKFILSIAITAITLAAEVVGGILTHSLALLSDAAHVFLDIFALALSYGAVRLAMRAPNSQHSFGFKRMKVIAAFINGSTLLIMAFEILLEALKRFSNPVEVLAGPMLIIAAIGLVSNLLVALVLKGHDHEDLNARAAFLHVIGDALSSVGVIVAGLLIMLTGLTWLDPLASILIVAMLLFQSIRVLKSAIHILNEGNPDGAASDEVRTKLETLPAVKDAHDIHVWTIEPGYRVLSAHIVVDDMAVSATAPIANGIKAMLHDSFDIEHATLQFECSPCGQDCQDPDCDKARHAEHRHDDDHGLEHGDRYHSVDTAHDRIEAHPS